MLVAAGLVPSAPLLVPQLAGAAAAETADLRDAVLAVGSALARSADRWIVIGTGPGGPVRARVGTYAAFGVDVRVHLGPEDASGSPDPAMPLAALTAAWIRTTAAPGVTAEVHTFAPSLGAQDCRAAGAALREALADGPEPVGLLVVGDGATTLTDKAPGAFHPDAPELQSGIDDALARADTGALTRLEERQCTELGVDGRVPWQILAAVMDGVPVASDVRYVGAPYGVGYFCGMWNPVRRAESAR